MPTMIAALAAQETEKTYQYLRPGGVAFSLTAMIIGLLIGGLLACIITVFHNRGVLRFLLAIRRAGADSKEKALTLKELGIPLTPSLRHALRTRSSLLRKLVSVALPDGRVLEPLVSRDDAFAKEAAEASAIHADEPKKDENPEKIGESDAEEADTAPIYYDPRTATYFMDDLHRRRAEVRFDKRGNDLRVLIPAIAGFAILIATLPVYFPYAVEALDALLITIFGG